MKKNSKLMFHVTVMLFVRHCTAANILGMFPVGSKSQFSFNEAIMKSLWKAGHHVTVFSPFPNPKPLANFTDIDLSNVIFVYVGQSSVSDFSEFSLTDVLKFQNSMALDLCEKVLSTNEMKKILNSKEKQFDVIVTQLLRGVNCLFPVASKLGIPVIVTSALVSASEVSTLTGNPENPAYVPNAFSGYSTNMNFNQRIRNVCYYLCFEFFEKFVFPNKMKQFYLKYFNDLPQDAVGTESKISLAFTNGHHGLLPRPNLPNCIELGGIHVSSAKSLPQKILKFIEEAEHGVVLFTFGSVARPSSIKSEVFEAFKQAFAEIPQRVIWKYDNQTEVMPNNVMALDWVPQQDILEHKNVKAFISHCGQAGMYESIYTATPVIAVPLFADQKFDAALLEDRKAAIRLDYDTLSKDDVLQAIHTIINDTKYADNMKHLSDIVFRDQILSSQELAVYWTEYVIRHNGADHLRYAGHQLSWYEYLLLDVLAFVLVSFILIMYTVAYIFKRILRLLFQRGALKSHNSASEQKNKL